MSKEKWMASRDPKKFSLWMVCDEEGWVLASKLTREAADLIAAAPRLRDTVIAGGAYMDALAKYRPNQAGNTVTCDELDQLMEDWHNKSHAALALVEGK